MDDSTTYPTILDKPPWRAHIRPTFFIRYSPPITLRTRPDHPFWETLINGSVPQYRDTISENQPVSCPGDIVRTSVQVPGKN